MLHIGNRLGEFRFEFWACICRVNPVFWWVISRKLGVMKDDGAVIQSLKLLGVDYAQGYYLGNPASMDELGSVKPSDKEISGTPVN